MKLTDLVSPEEFAAMANCVNVPEPLRQKSMDEVMPYFELLMETDMFDECGIRDVSAFMTALSIFQRCLDEQKVQA